MTEGGKRLDEGKLRWDLLPIPPIEELIKVYTHGATKYEPWNWYKGLKYSRVYAPLMRHVTTWWKGESIDKEFGLNHMAHVAWNAITLLTYELEKRTDLDDRIKEATK